MSRDSALAGSTYSLAPENKNSAQATTHLPHSCGDGGGVPISPGGIRPKQVRPCRREQTKPELARVAPTPHLSAAAGSERFERSAVVSRAHPTLSRAPCPQTTAPRATLFPD